MKKLSSLVAAASLLACGSAFAFNPSTTTPELTVTLSGASAQDVAVLKILASYCDAGTLDVFNETGEKKPKNFNAYACTIDLHAGSAFAVDLATITQVGNLAAHDTNGDGKLDVLLYKRSGGGSGEATNGICGDISVTKQVLIDNTCTAQGAGNVPSSSVSANWWKCTGSQQKQSDGGLMDLELNKFPSPYNSVCSSAGVTLKVSPIWGTIFNTPVSLNFRNALQCAQGLSVGAEDETNMPSLPKEVVASAFNGGIVSWDKLFAKDATGTYTTLAAAVASKVAAGQCPATVVAPTTAAGKRVIVCRRPVSSGTLTQFRVQFLNAGCSGEAQDILGDNTPNSTNVATTVAEWTNVGSLNTSAAIVEASGSGDMGNCLSAFADSTVNKWAIGHQSLENNVNGSAAYRFIKIDGNAPTLSNVLTHKYFDWVESNWMWSTAANADTIDFQQVLLTNSGKASQISDLIGTTVGAGFNFSFGPSGLVALNTVTGNVPAYPFTSSNVVANPTATASHGTSSCRTPQVKVNTAF